jgi:hypothetical protein
MSVEALLGGLGGALAVFFLGWLKEWWRGEQERRGVLTLLLAETKHNAEVIQSVLDRVDLKKSAMEDLIGHPMFAELKTRTWTDVQQRAAALLPSYLMETLQAYYSPLETLLPLIHFPNMASDSFDRTLRSQIKEAYPEKTVAATRNPYREQLDKFLAAQERTLAEIEEYLDRPRWGLCSCALRDGPVTAEVQVHSPGPNVVGGRFRTPLFGPARTANKCLLIGTNTYPAPQHVGFRVRALDRGEAVNKRPRQ